MDFKISFGGQKNLRLQISKTNFKPPPGGIWNSFAKSGSAISSPKFSFQIAVVKKIDYIAGTKTIGTSGRPERWDGE
ncbi:MAG: hypothetical protein AAGN35_18075 [Bacteroidota bacterium]